MLAQDLFDPRNVVIRIVRHGSLFLSGIMHGTLH
jgi:hypothetical protein